jgi:tRNA A37 N6-isopentenylltransferase MiaA
MCAIQSIHKRDAIAVVVGGATMWLDWLLHGKPKAPPAAPAVRLTSHELLHPFVDSSSENRDIAWTAAVELVEGAVKGTCKDVTAPNLSADEQRHWLSVLSKVPKNNYKQLSRCLEIALSGASVPISTQLEERTGGLLRVFKTHEVLSFFVSSPRAQLYERLDTRCVNMLECGLLTEVTELLCKGHLRLPQRGSFSKSVAEISTLSIGYRQSAEFLTALTNLPADPSVDQSEFNRAFVNFVRQFGSASRNYAKYQMQWFRRDEDFIWLTNDVSAGTGVALKRAVTEILHWCSVFAGNTDVAARELAYLQLQMGCLYEQLLKRQQADDTGQHEKTGSLKFVDSSVFLNALRVQAVNDPRLLKCMNDFNFASSISDHRAFSALGMCCFLLWCYVLLLL